jgi:hypothetical protein|mmetsp:Transcript_2439/g.4425  ORF Transcript_2439/g.4425 Transcript_2439/m.4425 type:complete len:80 (+) Transcript_2439:407-646(+)
MDSILKHWSLRVKELEKQGKWTEAFQLDPKGVAPHELIAEKLFEFERPDVDAIPQAGLREMLCDGRMTNGLSDLMMDRT